MDLTDQGDMESLRALARRATRTGDDELMDWVKARAQTWILVANQQAYLAKQRAEELDQILKLPFASDLDKLKKARHPLDKTIQAFAKLAEGFGPAPARRSPPSSKAARGVSMEGVANQILELQSDPTSGFRIPTLEEDFRAVGLHPRDSDE